MYFFSQIPSTGESPAGDAKRLRIQDRQKKVESKFEIENNKSTSSIKFLDYFPKFKDIEKSNIIQPNTPVLPVLSK